MPKERRSPRKVPHHTVFPVVGIGASAGGLEAFTAFLRALSPDTGMAFVLVQHMDPSHDSLLYQLLSKATVMPVTQVSDGMSLQPNRVYVIPPNKDLTINRGVLRLASLRAVHMPIDTFFASLAEDQQEKAIGVILSGTASDGTRGLKAIKNFGGITFAQDPKSAKYDGMPMSAVASGYVDFVLRPQQIAEKLDQHARHHGVDALDEVPVPAEGSAGFQKILRLLRTTTDVDFSLYKQATLKRRIRRRMMLREIQDLDQYVRYLKTHTSEIYNLFEDILIPVTSFFREPKTYQALQSDIFPKIAAKSKSIRIWVAGCSTGEEAYSIAIALLEYLEDHPTSIKPQIFGTDLSERAIQIARNGLYAPSSVENVSPDRLRRFFLKTEGGYQITKSIRELCIFARHDLAKDPPFAKLDLISCQNVFIYFESALQEKMTAAFHYALKPSGFLVFGKSEAPVGYKGFFTLESRQNKIFKRKPLAIDLIPAIPAPFVRETHPAHVSGEASILTVIEEARRILLENYSAPAVIVDPDLNILHFLGETSPYIQPSSGAASFHLLKMLRPEFAVDVRSLVHRVKKAGAPVRKEGIELEHDGKAMRVEIEVVPVHSANSTGTNFMVLFRRMAVAQDRLDGHPGRGKRQGDREFKALRRELAETRTSLKSITEDQEVANEELKTANEEILSSNEELQITNEELETAKEELQSANEELTTLNDELQNRNVELSTFANDLSSLLTGSTIPIVILDEQRRIQRFTPAALNVFKLTPNDIGRPFDKISSTLQSPDWNELISSVTDRLQPVETEVMDGKGRWYSLRIRPYKTSENRIDGVLMALLDVSELKGRVGHAEESLRKSQEQYQLMAENTRDLVSLHNADGKYIYASPSRERLLGYSQQEIVEHLPSEFCREDDGKKVALAFRNAVRSGKPTQVTYCALTRARQEVWLEALISPVKDKKGKTTRLIAVSRDITGRKAGDDKIRESEYMIRALLESASQGIVVVDRTGSIVLANRTAEVMFGYRKEELLKARIQKLISPDLRWYEKEHGKVFTNPKTRLTTSQLNIWGHRKSGQDFPAELSVSYIQLHQGAQAVAFVTDASERRRAEEALQESHDKLLDLSRKLMSAQDEERKRMSRELHDAFSQELAALSTESRLVKRELPLRARNAAKKVEEIAHRIGKLATHIQQMSRRLHPAILDDLGLESALRSECYTFSELYGIHVDLRVGAVPRSLPASIALCLYRIAQESLQNVVKHSGSFKAVVVLDLKKEEIRLAIKDSGRGFDLQAQKRRKRGLGLVGMEERARLVGGRVTIESGPGQGTRVLVRIPLKSKQ